MTITLGTSSTIAILSFSYFRSVWIAQWKFSSQKGMKNNFLAKAGFEPVTAEFPW